MFNSSSRCVGEYGAADLTRARQLARIAELDGLRHDFPHLPLESRIIILRKHPSAAHDRRKRRDRVSRRPAGDFLLSAVFPGEESCFSLDVSAKPIRLRFDE